MATNVTSLLRTGSNSASCRIPLGICVLPRLVTTTRHPAPLLSSHPAILHASLSRLQIANVHAYALGRQAIERESNSRQLKRNPVVLANS